VKANPLHFKGQAFASHSSSNFPSVLTAQKTAPEICLLQTRHVTQYKRVN